MTTESAEGGGGGGARRREGEDEEGTCDRSRRMGRRRRRERRKQRIGRWRKRSGEEGRTASSFSLNPPRITLYCPARARRWHSVGRGDPARQSLHPGGRLVARRPWSLYHAPGGLSPKGQQSLATWQAAHTRWAIAEHRGCLGRSPSGALLEEGYGLAS